MALLAWCLRCSLTPCCYCLCHVFFHLFPKYIHVAVISISCYWTSSSLWGLIVSHRRHPLAWILAFYCEELECKIALQSQWNWFFFSLNFPLRCGYLKFPVLLLKNRVFLKPSFMTANKHLNLIVIKVLLIICPYESIVSNYYFFFISSFNVLVVG